MIDSHCHLADEVFREDLAGVIGRARDAGLERALVILAAGDPSEEAQAGELVRLWTGVRFAVGVHPHAAHEYGNDPGRAATVVGEQIRRIPQTRAIGEIGLDYHYDFSPRPVQQAVFRAQLELARELDRPVVIHTREAEADTLTLLTEQGPGGVRGVFHCFTGTAGLARAGLELGFYISMGGIVTFPKATELRETLAGIPLDRLLIETDSPFLAPAPHRGKRNEPANVGRVAEVVAQVYGVTPAAVAEQTTANFNALFGT